MILMSSPWVNGLFWIISTLKHNCLTSRENSKLQFEEVVVTYLYIWNVNTLLCQPLSLCAAHFTLYEVCILYYDVRVPGIWVRAFKKSTMQLAPILRIRHFVYVLSRVPGHGRHRHRNSLTQTESQRVWVRNFKLNTLLRTLWASCRSRNANVRHKFPQWYHHVSANR